MIIRQDKTFESSSIYLSTNWYKNEENYVIDETTKTGLKMKAEYIENYPFVDFEHDGECVTKIILLDKPEKPEEVKGKRIELIKDKDEEWGYIYVDIPKSKNDLQQELNAKILKDNAVYEMESKIQKELNADLLLKIAELEGV